MTHNHAEESRQANIALLAATVILIGGLGMTGLSWVQLGLSASILAVVLWVNIGSKWLRHRRMRFPFDVYLQPSAETQGSRTELRLAAHATGHIEIRVEPKLHYVQNEIAIGVQGDEATRPRLLKMRSRFVKRGLNAERSPDDTDGHYIDYTDRYHIKERADRTKGNTYALGFVVETREPGIYPVSVVAMTDDGEGNTKSRLTLRVE